VGVTKESIPMSQKEMGRLEVIQATVGKQIRQVDASRQLGLSIRQVKRLVRRYRRDGAAGLVSGHRGQRPNNAIAAGVREEAMNLVQSQYADFTPTFAHEELTEIHGYGFSVETLHQWRINGVEVTLNSLSRTDSFRSVFVFQFDGLNDGS